MDLIDLRQVLFDVLRDPSAIGRTDHFVRGIGHAFALPSPDVRFIKGSDMHLITQMCAD